jgi:PAS domain S-box-containing protein
MTTTTAHLPGQNGPWPASQQAWQMQRDYNQLIATTIGGFGDILPSQLDAEIERTLQRLGQITQVDSCYLFSYDYETQTSTMTHEWCPASPLAQKALAQAVPCWQLFPWSSAQLMEQQVIAIPQVAHLPAAAAIDQANWQKIQYQALVLVPLVQNSVMVGAIGLAKAQPVAQWPEETIQLVQIVGQMMTEAQRRIHNEQRLQASEERLRLALSATNQGLYDLNLTTGEVVVSPEYATLLGYDPQTFRETIERWIERLHPDDRDCTVAAFQAYLAGHRPDYRVEFRQRTQLGTWQWILSLGKIVAWAEDGTPVRMLGTHTDISALKQAESARRESEACFRAFMDNSPTSAWIMDPETNRLEYANQRFWSTYALHPQSGIGQTLFELFPPDIAAVYASNTRRVAAINQMIEVVEPGLRIDQSRGEFLSFKFPLPQPNHRMLVGGIAIDITDRKRIERRLALQSSVLERIACSEPLLDILDALVRAAEAQLEGSLCSILRCGGDDKLYGGIAPNLPPAYNQALEGLPIGEAMGSCGTAAQRREMVIVEDLATDPLWHDFKDLALAHGLRACCSMPVFASEGPVLATFAVYHREPHRPDDYELETMKLVVNIAKIAIEQDQATRALEQLNRELEDRVTQRTAALQRSQARLREAQQVAHLGSWEMDVETRTITWADEVLSIFGLPSDGPSPSQDVLLQHFPPTEWVRFGQLVDRAVQLGEPCTTDLQIRRADGSMGYIFVKAAPSRSGALPGPRVFGIVMDISDRRAMQEALQRSEERTRATLLALPDLVFRVDREGRYLDFMASPQTGNLVDPQASIGKRLREALPSKADNIHIEQKYQALQTALVSQTVQCYEQQIWLNGQLRHEEVRVAPCGNDEVVFFIRDISDRKQAEAELQTTNQELARATRLKDEFLANMSHELRTPLNAILGMAEGLQEEIFGQLNPRQIKALTTIERSGAHLLELINDILDSAKIESGQISLDCTPIAVPYLCQSSLAFIKQQAHQKNIQLVLNIPNNLPDLQVDERRIRQVLINLLNNAVKFTPAGGTVTLTVSTLPPRQAPESHFLHLAISDTGIGIAAEDIHKLFQPFVQIDSALNRQYNGTGLGLALVKRIVELHGGRVEVTSELGVGSCFTLELPCIAYHYAQAAAPQLEPCPAPAAVYPSAPLILLAEDNEVNICTISSYLGAKGYRMVLAKTGQAAVELAQAHQPDLILMDIQMPDLDGIEATRQIRCHPNLVTTPIIALTALAMPADRDRCLAAGANDYLSKPVKLKQLTTTIQHFLSTQNKLL